MTEGIKKTFLLELFSNLLFSFFADWIKVYPGFCPEFLNYNPSTVSQRDFVEKVEPVMDTSSNLLSTASAKAVLKYISAISKHAHITSKEGISKKEEFNTSPGMDTEKFLSDNIT